MTEVDEIQREYDIVAFHYGVLQIWTYDTNISLTPCSISQWIACGIPWIILYNSLYFTYVLPALFVHYHY